MDFSVFEPILELREELLSHLKDLMAGTAKSSKDEGAPLAEDKATAGLMRSALKQRERVLAALAASRPDAASRIEDILRAAAMPLPSVGAPPGPGLAKTPGPKKPAGKKSAAKEPASKKLAAKKPAAKSEKTGPREA